MSEKIENARPVNHQDDLNAWLQERGLAIQLVAVGRVTATVYPIADFEPPTHRFDYALFYTRPEAT